jgi:hypothetical protein
MSSFATQSTTLADVMDWNTLMFWSAFESRTTFIITNLSHFLQYATEDTGKVALPMLAAS